MPRRAREHLGLRPGMTFTVVSKGAVIILVPERAMRGYRGVVPGVRARGLREENDRL